MTPWQKAALLVAHLDAATADHLLELLPPEAARRIRNSVMALDRVSPSVLRRVIAEFLEQGERSARVDAVVEGGGRDSVRVVPSPRDVESRGEMPLEPELTEALSFERPHTIAAIVAAAAPGQAAQLLDSLPVAMQADILRRLARLGTPNTVLVRWIGQQFRQRRDSAAAASHAFDDAGVSNVLRILDAGLPQCRTQLLDELARVEPELAEMLETTPS